jgi:hypothetical protein
MGVVVLQGVYKFIWFFFKNIVHLWIENSWDFQIAMIEQNYICKHFMNSCNIHASSLVHRVNWIEKKNILIQFSYKQKKTGRNNIFIVASGLSWHLKNLWNHLAQIIVVVWSCFCKWNLKNTKFMTHIEAQISMLIYID